MNYLHKFAVLALSAVLTVCLLAGCGASASSTASSAASSVASSVAASEAASSAASKAQATVEFTVTAADGSVSSVLLNVTDGEKLSTALAEAGIISQDEDDAGFVTTVNGETADYDKDQAWWCLPAAAGELTTTVTAMPLPTPRGKKPAALHTRVLRLVLSGLMGALLVVSKQAMSGLPNLEPVSLLLILFALELPRETPGAITVFILLQGVLYGFGLWWVMYLYVWYLLALLAWLLRRMDNALGWAVFSGSYGLCFGGLCAAVYLVAKTPAFALSWWLSGLSYDAMHGVGNFVIMLLLYRPLRRALQTAKRQLRVN